MVETIMIFALGFLAASLIALLIIPAINARAERLARRRAEALFPMSISELTAEKDHLRAEFAVMQRRIERKAEEAQAIKHQTMEELGRRAVRIEALETDLAERGKAISELQAALAETSSRLASTAEELATTQASLAGTRDTLGAIEDAHRKTLDELTANRSELERTNIALAATRAELITTRERLSAREIEFADLSQGRNAALSDLDTKRITISDLETRLATQTARGNEFERALGERRNELSEERQRLAELAKSLLAEQEQVLALKGRVHDLESERDAKAAEQSALREQLENAKAEKASLEEAVAAARADSTRLEEEVKTLRRTDGAISEEIRSGNAELRRRIAEVADEVMRVAGQRSPEPKGHRKAG